MPRYYNELMYLLKRTDGIVISNGPLPDFIMSALTYHYCIAFLTGASSKLVQFDYIITYLAKGITPWTQSMLMSVGNNKWYSSPTGLLWFNHIRLFYRRIESYYHRE